MPIYVFECQECNVRFERNLKMGDHETHPCPSCALAAPRAFDGEAFGFGFKEPETAVQGNTGVHKEDYPTADHAVGKDAEKRWELIHEREKVKGEARVIGKTHALIRRTDPAFIDYEPMTTNGLEARKKLSRRAIEVARNAREARGTR